MGEWGVLGLRDLLLMVEMMLEKKTQEAEIRNAAYYVGRFFKDELSGVVFRVDGWPVAFILISQSKGQLKQVKIHQWGEIPEVGHTNVLFATMATFLGSLPKQITSVTFMVPERNVDLQMNLKTCGFKCVRLVPSHYKSGDDGYLFLKRLHEPTEDNENGEN